MTEIKRNPKQRPRTMVSTIAIATVMTCLLSHPSSSSAFVPHSISPSTTLSSTRLYKIPVIDEWEVLKSGAIKGTISNHPTLPDGYEITTSALDEKKSNVKNNSIVITSSGSKYKLKTQLENKSNSNNNNNNNNRPTLSFGGAKPKPKAQPKPQVQSQPKSTPKPKQKPVVKAKPKPKPTPKLTQTPKINTKNYNLNGKVVGSGGDNEEIFLLVGNLIKSSSKRSQIYYAYKADNDGNPTGPRLTVKLTNSIERLAREDKNYNRVFTKGRVLFSIQGSGSCYVKKVAFYPNIDASPSTKGIPKGNSALILESGDENLRVFLSNSGSGLKGGQLRKAAVSVARCVEAMHSSGLVWTDLKAENFVLVGNDVKAIDLESAVPNQSTPEDYSPEACPPEFAAAERAGQGYNFQVQRNYDSWSLGMVFFEMATGRNYFAGQGESAIFNALATLKLQDPENPDCVLGLEAIPDERFRDLVRQCLSINPKKRPSIESILLHPYFLTTGLGPLSF